MRGYLIHGRKINVVLSDGRIITEGNNTVERIERNFVDFSDLGRLWLIPPRDRTTESSGVSVFSGRNPNAPKTLAEDA